MMIQKSLAGGFRGWISWISALIIGALGGLVCYGHLIARYAQHGQVVIPVSIASVVLLTCLSYVTLTQLVTPRLRAFHKNHRVLWVIGALLASMLFIIVTPLPIPTPERNHTLTLIATAKPGSVSSGGEVWVIQLQGSNGLIGTLNVVSTDWGVSENLVVSRRRKPDPLLWSGPIAGDLHITFITHPPTGNVQIMWDEQEQELNLDTIATQPPIVVLPATQSSRADDGLLLAVLYGIATIVCLALAILALALFFTRPIAPSMSMLPQHIGPWWLLGSLLCIVCWGIYLLAFWPGIMSADSLSQWQQAIQGQFDDWHPAIHSMLIWLLIHIWPSPAAVTVTQIVVLALVVGITIREASAWGVPRIVCIILALFYSLSPVNGMMTVTLWKDILYSTAMLALFTLLLAFVRTRGRVLNNSYALLGLIVTATCLSMFRHNGILVGVPVLLLLILVSRGQIRRQALIAGVSCLLLIGLVRYGLYPALNVGPTPSVLKYNSFAFQMSAYIHNGVVLSAADQEVISRIQPIDSWRDNYGCYNVNPTFFNGKFNLKIYEDTIPAFMPIWWQTTLAHPDILFKHEVCLTAMIWRIFPYPDTMIYADSTGIDPNSLGVVQQPVWPAAHTALTEFFAWTLEPRQVWLIWYPALYLYAIMVSITLVAIRMRSVLYMLPIAPALINSASWIILATAHDFRYQYGVYLIAPIAVALITSRSYTGTSPIVDRPIADSRKLRAALTPGPSPIGRGAAQQE
ncbi:MAG: DUF6020 family protein [Roseiflexaceae bacterium]|nr:DUF6020 family protein [Roseiflexaceae bacterium]